MDVCSIHSNCTDVFPFACQQTVASSDPFLLESKAFGGSGSCNPYSTSARQPMYCAKSCLTGGCGSKGDVNWGGQVYVGTGTTRTLDPTRGYCQPCNGCTAMNTLDGGSCPSHCTTGLPSTVSLTGVNTTVIKDPNAVGSWTLDAWVKDFQYQYVVTKAIEVDGSHPNHRWEGYSTKSVSVQNVDKYLPIGMGTGCWFIRIGPVYSDQCHHVMMSPCHVLVTSEAHSPWHHVRFAESCRMHRSPMSDLLRSVMISDAQS